MKEDELRYSGSLLVPSTLRPSSSSILSLTPSSGSSTNPYATHFPVPPPLIPYPKSPFLPSGHGGFPTPPTDPLHSPGFPWASPTLTALGMLPAFSPLPGGGGAANVFPTSPLAPFTSSSSLLTPSPSYHSSSASSSSREELLPPHSHHHHFLHHAAAAAATSSSLMLDKKPMLTAPTPRYGPIPSLMASAQARVLPDSSSPAPSSPMLSPRTWSHSWPTPVWQCFVAGTYLGFGPFQF